MTRNRQDVRSTAPTIGFLAAGAVTLVLWCGCGGDARLAGRKIRNVTVQSVSHYGVTLDQQAPPEQVAFVLLRAIRDDVRAKNMDERQAALDKQFDLCAANVLQKRNRTSLPRDEFIHSIVYQWAPTVSHYAGDFETEREKAVARFVRKAAKTESKAGSEECEVQMELADPSGDANARVVMTIWMAMDAGFWRVTHLGFDAGRRSIEK